MHIKSESYVLHGWRKLPEPPGKSNCPSVLRLKALLKVQNRSHPTFCVKTTRNKQQKQQQTGLSWTANFLWLDPMRVEGGCFQKFCLAIFTGWSPFPEPKSVSRCLTRFPFFCDICIHWSHSLATVADLFFFASLRWPWALLRPAGGFRGRTEGVVADRRRSRNQPQLLRS